MLTCANFFHLELENISIPVCSLRNYMLCMNEELSRDNYIENNYARAGELLLY